MRIQNNIPAANAHRQLGINSSGIAKTTEKLSSGYRVNRAADDAAGLAISEKMRTQIRGLSQASKNIQDGVSLLQVGDAILGEMSNMVHRMRELSVQAANDTNQNLDRQAIQLEIDQLTSEINDIARTAEFNRKPLFDGSVGAPRAWHLGIQTQAMNRTPASITAGQVFQPGSISAWTIPSNFGISGTTNLNTLEQGMPPGSGPNFPKEGIFAIQLQTPANGNLNIVLDFAQANPSGDFALADFLQYFKDAFDHFTNVLDLDIPIVEDVRIGSGGQIQLVFPRDPISNRPLGIMGLNGSTPRVHIGIGAAAGWVGSTWLSQATQIASLNSGMRYPPGSPNIPSNAVFANSAIFGANDTNYISNNGYMLPPLNTLTPTQITYLESLMSGGTSALGTTLTTSTEVWALLPDSATFVYEARRYPSGQPSFVVDNQTFVKGSLPPGVTTLAEFSAHLASTAAASPHWNSMSATPSLHRDRDGNFYVSFSRSASPSNSGDTYSINVHPSFHSATVSGLPTIPSNTSGVSYFPASASDEIGLLTITIGNIPNGASTKTATITVDFSQTNFSDFASAGYATREDYMVSYINSQLNAAANHPVPPPLITAPGYSAARPVATASLNSSGYLVLTVSERRFNISVNETLSDNSMYANFAPAQVGTGATNSMTVAVGTPPQNRVINIVPGDYVTIDGFVNANRTAFASAGFILSHKDGSLVVTTIQGGEHVTFSPPAVTTNPPSLLTTLGFASGNIYVDGETLPVAEVDSLWIQAGANENQGVFIAIPRLCARSLGLAMWRPIDEDPPWVGYASLGASQYSDAAKINPAMVLEPPGYSLDVTSHIKATSAISVIDNALNILSSERAQFGAMTNRLEFARANVNNAHENLSAAESRIRDADIASEHMRFVKENILVQSSTAMLAQANALPQGVLQIIG